MAENKKILDINEDLYELLGVDPDAETIDIKKKYRDLARQMHPDKNRNAQNSADLFIKINHAHLYLINPTTRLIYNAFGLSGLEVYEQSIEDFEKVEKRHQEQEGEGDEENKQETEQKILTKTIHLISETTRRHLIQEYDISSSLEVGIDWKDFCDLYGAYVKYRKDGRLKTSKDLFSLIRYRQSVIETSFKVPYWDWMSGEVTMKSHSDMRQALAIGSFDYQNNVSLPYGFDLINTAEFSPNSNSLNTQIRKSIIHDLINIGLSCRYDEKGFNPVEIEASTGFSTKFRDTTFGIDTSIGFNSISMAPKIQFKLLEDAVLSWSMKVNSSDQDLVLGGQLGILYKLSSTLQLGVFGDISSKNSKLTSIISVHVGLLGFNFKVPFFCGTETEGPSGTFWDSGLAVTLGIFGIANAFTFGAYKTYRKFKRIKKYSKLDVDFTKFQEKMKRFKDEETKLEENMRRNRNLENSKLIFGEILGDLIIIDAIMGHKAHIRQIVKGQKRFEEPLATAEQYNHCQVYRIKSKLQSMVQNNSLTISENIIFEEPEIFNPRRYHGDISVYVTFRFR